MADTRTVVEEAYSAFNKRDPLLQRKIVTSERKRRWRRIGAIADQRRLGHR